MTSALRTLAAFAIAAAALSLVPIFGGAYVTTFVLSMIISFILAQSWDWVGGEMGYLNLGHFAFYGIGAYSFSLALVAGWSLPLCFLCAAAVPILMAAVLAVPLFRLRGDYFAFATLAMVPLFELLANNLSGITGGSEGINLPPSYVLTPAYVMAAVLALAAVAMTLGLTSSRFGYALKAIRNDEQVAEVIGIRLLPAKTQTLALSAVFAGLAGAVQAWQFSFIDPFTMFNLSFALVPVAMALLGGSGLLWGPLVGVVLLATAQQLLLVNLNMLQATIYGLAILLIGRYLPGGLLRSKALRTIPLLSYLGHEHHRRLVRPPRVPSAAAPETGLPLDRIPDQRGRVLLECRKATLAFGGLVAVNNVDLTVRQGEIIGLVGPNGSGKTSLFNLISGVYAPTGGEIVFDGASLRGLRRDEISHRGIGRTYQIPRPFGDLTARENIAAALMFRNERLTLATAMQEAESFAIFAGLTAHLDERADSLSLQQKKGLEFSRALAGRPRLLLVDEVASGLSTPEVNRFVQHIREVRDRYGLTVIWVEHIFSALEQTVDRLVVLEEGNVIADGPLRETMRDPRVLTTYLGTTKGRADAPVGR